MNCKVSVIIPFFNSEKTLARCLDSVKSQSLIKSDPESVQIILVNDGSSDGSYDLAEKFKSQNILNCTLISYDSNKGPSYARNRALEIVEGEYLVFVDSDDSIDPFMLEKMLAKANLTNADLVTCGRLGIDSETDKVIKRQIPKYDLLEGDIWSNPSIAKRTGNLLCDKMLKRSLIEEHDLYFNEKIHHAEDFLFLSLYRLYMNNAAAVPEALYFYYMHNYESVSSSNKYVLDIPDACQIVIDNYLMQDAFDATNHQLLYVMLGFYIRKCLQLQNNPSMHIRFKEELQSIFNTYFVNSWKKVLKQRCFNQFNKAKASAIYRQLIKPVVRDSSYDSSSVEGFLFSVIIPVYNAENYLCETAESVMDQSIGYQNIQLILVDDGSTDGSLEICQQIKDKYPGNVIVISQQNKGVSAARNTGLKAAKGKYINFLDSDDKWSKNAFREALDFFSKHQNVQIVSARIKYFDARKGNHPLNYKFKRSQMVDIEWQPSFIQLSLPSCFLTREVLSNHSFNEHLQIAEDMLFVNQILASIGNYGVLKYATYKYRKRKEANSALDSASKNRSYYFETLQFCHMELISLFQDTKYTKYLEYLLMYDLQWRIKDKDQGFLSLSEKSEYKKSIVKLLQFVSDETIINQRNISAEHKAMVLAIKYGLTFSEVIEQSSTRFLAFRKKIERTPGRFDIDFLSIEDNGLLKIEGEVFCLKAGLDYSIEVKVHYVNSDEMTYSPKKLFKRTSSYKNAYFEDGFFCPISLMIELPIKEGIESLEFFAVSNTEKYKLSNIKFRKFVRLSNKLKFSMYETNCYRIIYSPKSGLKFLPRDFQGKAADKIRFSIAILHKHKGIRVLTYVILASLLRKVLRKQRWIISDRIIAGGDNGQALFEYLSANPLKEVKPYFAISKQSDDFRPLSKIGKVVPYGSVRYKLLFLISTLVISSAADEYVINAFGKNREVMKCFYNFKYVFLQHGITKDNQSSWLNRYNKNIELLLSAAKPEYQSFISTPEYYYSEEQVKLIGFPRHDKLLNNKAEKKNIILIMPTWRTEIAGSFDVELGRRRANPHFNETEYYIFYNSLLNDPYLHELLMKYDFKIRFIIHPALVQEAKKFNKNEFVDIPENIQNYTLEFQNASLLITDFSSVAFDFALLKKPIIYSQFDKGTFFSGHLYDKGYFDYDSDGFGPVCQTKNEVISEVEKCLTNGCKISKKYSTRIENFFGEQPASRCENLVKELLRIARK